MQVTESGSARDRRHQIIAATIEVLATRGWAQTSFERVREHAGISSTRLISYHFAGRDDLMRSVLEFVVADGRAHMMPAIAQARDAASGLRAYIESNIAYLAARPSFARAAIEVINNLKRPDGQPDRTAGRDSVAVLAARLRAGQADGSFRAFDPTVMASAIRAAIDGTAALIADADGADMTLRGRELATLFDLATRADSSRHDTAPDERKKP